jgi:hypothetical protein
MQTPGPPLPASGRCSQKSKTRISAMADFARKGKQEKKALPLFPLSDRCDDNPGALEKIFAGVSHAVAA